MSPVRPKPAATLPVRFLCLAGLLCLAVITLLDRGASRMYAAPWNIYYWGAVLLPPLLLLMRLGLAGPPLHLPAGPWRWLLAAAWTGLLAAAVNSPYRAPCLQWTALPLSGLAVFLLVHDWLQAAPANRDHFTSCATVAAGLLMLTSNGYWLLDVASLSRAEFFSTELFEMRNPHPLGHSNYTAGLALLSLPWLVAAGCRLRGLVRLLAIAGTGLALLALFTSGSRGGLIGLAALGVAALAGTQLDWKRFTLLTCATIIAAGALAIANPRIRAMLGPADPGTTPNISTVQRSAMFEAGLTMGLDRPLLGWGLHTIPLVYPRYRAGLDGGAENVLQLHSTPLELWAGLGATGLLLLGGFVYLAGRDWSRAPVAAATLAGYGVFALTDYQLDVPVFVFALAALTALIAAPAPAPAGPRVRLLLAGAALGGMALIATLGKSDRTPELNSEALALARDPAQTPRAIALLRESLALNPDQEIAHFNLGWLLLVREPADAERHFRAAAQLVPDKGGMYLGLGLARLNQGRSAAHAFALECLNDPRFLASPWWKEPAIAAQREATQAAFAGLAARARSALPPGTWTAQQTDLVASLAPRLGFVSPGPGSSYRRERTGYPVLMRNLDLAPPVDLYDVREDPRFPASVPFPLPAKGWLPTPLLLKLLDGDARPIINNTVPGPAANTLRETTLPAVLLAGDAGAAFAGLALGYWLRYATPLGGLGIEVPGARFGTYLPLLLLGVAFLVAAFAQQGLYDGRMLLRKQQNLNLLFRGTAYWLVAYLAFSLVIKFDPPISRLFVVLAAFTTMLLLWLWREAFYFALTRPALLPRLQRRVALLGWNDDARTLTAEINSHPAHPYTVVGHVTLTPTAAAGSPDPLGTLDGLPAILERERIDVLIAVDLDLPRADLLRVTEQCEHAYVEWKVLPTAFQIFLSGLRLQTVGSIPVLGVEDLAITRLLNRAAKRSLDVVGALTGLMASAPVIAVLAALIKTESPGGPVFFRQTRIGAGHRPFTLFKLRSMQPDADASDAAHQSTRARDPRLLRIGAFLRRWNLDELPQYWNVLCGQMSLVGPRPERPHHVDQLAGLIPHYLPRHLVKPGMTGWAQVNGLRGATDLEKRIRYDIFYIENWSLWLDCQIIALTFLRWKSPA